MTEAMYRRAARILVVLALAAAACLLAGWATPAQADLDRIHSYTVTVDPRADGSADITYDIDWEVISGSPDEPLSWVRIGLANSAVDDFENLSPDTVSQVRYRAEGGGSFAQVVFKNRYYAPDYAAQVGGESRVRFAFRVHQSELYTLNGDGSADYVFTPGWFSDLSIDDLTIRWKALDGMQADTDTLEDGYYVWAFGALDHDERAAVRVSVPAEIAAAFTPDTVMPVRSGRSPAFIAAVIVLPFAVMVLVILLALLLRRPRWRGGFGAAASDWDFYTDGVHTIHLAPGVAPPAGYTPATPPAGHTPAFKAGGGRFRGGGAGRSRSHDGGSHNSGCACACACVSCACACACAGGGRAGCSAKNFYRITMDTPGEEPR